MPRIPIFRLGHSTEQLQQPRLARYAPTLPLEGLQLGVDNLRHDVHLSSRFVEQGRVHIARLIARYGDVEGLLEAECPEAGRGNHFIGSGPKSKATKSNLTDLKPLLAAIHTSALNRAKADGSVSVDMLARVAILKFLRVELSAQFSQLLERCRIILKNYDGVRQQKAIEYREQVAAFQVAKKIILRKTGQELFRTLREVEKETLARTRRSLFGSRWEERYSLFLNPLIFTEDGRDAYLNAEHYVMFGNFDRDPDRFANACQLARDFLESLELGRESQDEAVLDSWLSVPENAQELVGAGTPDESTLEGRSQKARLIRWTEVLEQSRVLDFIVASYEVVPLLAEYSPRINAQQLKNALVSREERDRVEKLIAQHGRLSPDSLYAAAGRVASCRAADRAKVAGRFLRDLLRYHRDLRRLEALNGAMDSVNLIGSAKLRELSAMNGTLYEFLLEEEHRPSEEKVLRHVVIKADVRDSSRLTRSLMERGLNPASYFSLNFYDPVNKLLAKYGASKVFIEGDAVILGLVEREGEPGRSVGRACVLAREMIEIVNGYNQLLERSGLPGLELGVGISYQDSAPLYLMDGEQRIMISDALNESDRLSSCNKRLRKSMEPKKVPFHVYAIQTANGSEAPESMDDFLMNYNLNGIRLSEAAFLRLREEISLEPCKLELPRLFGSENYELFSGMVPVGNDIFRRIVVRASRMPQIDPRTFALQAWTERRYYEVCSSPAIYAALEKKSAAAR
ncbi:MAG TPA: hypothetical protein VJQ82_03105 [Terriglobales bacterium]|nr:hypothetical protein [Terriglobales bacterium]